jgi:hypothetical protein
MQGKLAEAKETARKRSNFAGKSASVKSQYGESGFGGSLSGRKETPNASANCKQLKKPIRHRISSCWATFSEFAVAVFRRRRRRISRSSFQPQFDDF